MAFIATPTTLLPGFVSDTTSFTILFSDLTWADLSGTQQPLLTADEASTDIRKIIRAFNMGVSSKILALPDADKPTRMSLNFLTPTTSGLPTGTTGILRRNFSGFFDEAVDSTQIDVAPE